MGFKEELSVFPHAKIKYNEPMKKHTSFGVGGKADYYVEVDSIYTLNEILSLCKKYRVRYKIIGNGTNLLFSEKGYKGLIINTKKLNSIYFENTLVRAMSGANLNELIKNSAQKNLSGLEWLYGIPASIGGAIVMNAGAFGHNIAERVIAVESLVDGKIKKYSKEECKFGYRTSRFLGKKEVIISATFDLTQGNSERIVESITAYKELRNSVQPSGRSCGSVFKNPLGDRAGRLIESAGLKGSQIGGATISQKHANFIIAKGKTTANDIYELIDYVKRKVKSQFGVQLEEEVECVGEF